MVAPGPGRQTAPPSPLVDRIRAGITGGDEVARGLYIALSEAFEALRRSTQPPRGLPDPASV